MSTVTDTLTRSPRAREFLYRIALNSTAVAVGLFFALPFVFVFLQALMGDQQSLTRDLWPNSFHWSNLVDIWKTEGFATWWRNSLIYAFAGTVLSILSSLPVAFALAHYKFRGRSLAMAVVIATMMLPPQVVIIPMYIFWSKQLHLTGSLWPLIVPLAFGDAFTIFLLRQFLLTIPQEYLEAARIDGCSEFRILTRVIVPMAKPAIAAAALFQFFYCWNDYFGPQIYLSENPGAWTLSLGLQSFKSAHHTNWNLTMAATVLVMAPVLIIFFLAQRVFVEGVTLTGVKG